MRMRKEIARAEETAFTGWGQHNISSGRAAPGSTSLAALAGGGRGEGIDFREDRAHARHQRRWENRAARDGHEAGHQRVFHQVLSAAMIAEPVNPCVTVLCRLS